MGLVKPVLPLREDSILGEGEFLVYSFDKVTWSSCCFYLSKGKAEENIRVNGLVLSRTGTV